MKKFFAFVMVLSLGWVAAHADCQDGPYGIQINGTEVIDAYKFGEPDYQGRVQYKVNCAELKAGDVIKLINKSCDATWMVDIDPYGSYENFEGGASAGQITCLVDGSYDFYIKLKQDDDLVYIGPAQSCGEVPGYGNAAPERCTDVMFQCFYWDSYKDQGYGNTKWKTLLESGQAEEIGKWFDLVWLPPMSKSTGGTGYHPIRYGSLDSDWGTKGNLTQLIYTLHLNGAKVVADIVINHAEGSSGWCTFAKQNFGTYGSFEPTAAWICKTDEMNSDPSAGDCQGKATGANDDGYGSEANYAAARDWDHTNSEVRDMFKAYLKWLRNDIKIDGYRYDYCKGFHNSHINDYNSASGVYFSVMEMWDGNVNELQSHLNDAGWNTTTFDFATKYTAFNNGIASGYYESLKGAGLPGAGKSRYAVTFLDSHDSFQRDNNEFCGLGNSMKYPGKIQQCYAYMLSMPGIPCVFYPHWVKFKDKLKPMINARYKTGVHSESAVSDETGSGYYKATITGTNGEIRVLIGPNSGYNSTPSGYTKAVTGENYGVYYKVNSARGDKDKERQPQGIEEVKGERLELRGEKFIENGQLYIRCGEQVFDVMGRLVK